MKKITIQEIDFSDFQILLRQIFREEIDQLKTDLVASSSEYITVAETTEKLNKSVATLYRMVRRGTISIYKLPGERGSYFKRSEIEAFQKI